jgi:hypothetical protein
MAITTYGDYDAWQKHAIITIDDGTYNVTLQALTETIDLDIGEREIDIINLLNLGQIAKFGAMGLTTLTFEGYALKAGTSDASGSAATGFWDIFAYKPTRYLAGTTDTDLAEPQAIPVTNQITRLRIMILWTNDSGVTTATSAVTSGLGYKGKRFGIADCICTGHKESFTDGVLKTTLTFKGLAFSKNASARIMMESGQDTNPLPAITGTYTPGEDTPFA